MQIVQNDTRPESPEGAHNHRERAGGPVRAAGRGGRREGRREGWVRISEVAGVSDDEAESVGSRNKKEGYPYPPSLPPFLPPSLPPSLHSNVLVRHVLGGCGKACAGHGSPWLLEPENQLKASSPSSSFPPTSLPPSLLTFRCTCPPGPEWPWRTPRWTWSPQRPRW